MLGQPDSFWINVGLALAVLVLVLVLALRQKRRQGKKPKIAEHRMAALYLQKDPDEIEDPTPYRNRARWAIILSSLSIVIVLYIAFYG